MENTVTISLDHYNELRDFNKAITDGKKLVIKNGWINSIEYYTDDELATELNDRIKTLKQELEDLKSKHKQESENSNEKCDSKFKYKGIAILRKK
jgi:hypothetical protein